jgi:ligand-binding sensor domain-containing protein
MPRMLRHPCFLAALALAGTAPAQTLAFRRYDVAEGLPSSRVNFVFPDSRGYVWLGTWEGLARFDGAEFTCYGTADGLPNFLVNAVAEDPDGGIWVATQGGGVARLVDRPEGTGPGAAPGSRAKFEAFRLGSSRESTIVLGLRFDPHGHLWCGTEAGVFRGTRGADGQLRFEPVEGSSGATWPQFALPSGTWLADAAGIFRAEGSRVASRLPPPAPGLGAPISLLERPGGGALAVFGSSAFELALPAGDDGAPTWKRLSLELAPNQEMRCAFYDSKGTLWIGTTSGLLRWRDGVETAYTTENGLPDNSIRALCEDRDGDLWMGTWSSGAVKLTGEAIVSYPLPADFPDRAVIRVVLAADGSIYGTTKGGIARLRDGRIEFVPGSREPEFHAIGLRFQQDRRGDFWIGSARGLLRAPGPDLDLRRAQRLGKEDGIPDGEVFGAIYEDRSGRIHVAMVQGDWYIWDPRTSSEPRFERRALERTADFDIPREFFEDSRGQLWLAPYVGLSRVVGDRLEKIEPSDGLPDVLPRFLFEDASSRLWVGTRFAGVSVTDDPAAEKPVFRNWSTRTGLASDAVWSIAQDAEGRVYFGTSRGMEQLDPATGRVRHVTTLDGLAGDIVNHLVRDRSGAIWAGTSGGFSRYDPRAEAPPPGPPPIYLSEIRIAGDLLPIPETGAVAGPDVTLPASRDNLVIAFVGLSFRTEREIAYEHRLEGVDESWSTPSPRRSVEYAHLAPGTYRFLVRARNADGLASSQPRRSRSASCRPSGAGRGSSRWPRPAWRPPPTRSTARACAGSSRSRASARRSRPTSTTTWARASRRSRS